MSSRYEKLKKVENQINELCLQKRLKVEAEHRKRIKCLKTLRLYINTFSDEEGMFIRIDTRVINDFKNTEELRMSDLIERAYIVAGEINEESPILPMNNNKHEANKEAVDQEANMEVVDQKANNEVANNQDINTEVVNEEDVITQEANKESDNQDTNKDISSGVDNKEFNNYEVSLAELREEFPILESMNLQVSKQEPKMIKSTDDSSNNSNLDHIKAETTDTNTTPINESTNNTPIADPTQEDITDITKDEDISIYEWVSLDDDVDSFELRLPSTSCKLSTNVKLILTLKNKREIYKLSPSLSSLLSLATSSKPNLIGSLYTYIVRHNLIDKENYIVKADDKLKLIFNLDSFLFTDLPELLEDHLFPLDDLILNIKSSVIDIPIEVDDLFQQPKVHHKDVYLLERKIDTINEIKTNLLNRKETLIEFSSNPIAFINKWICLDLEDFCNKTGVFKDDSVQEIMYELLKGVV